MVQPVEQLIGPSTCSKDQAFNLHGPYGDIQLPSAGPFVRESGINKNLALQGEGFDP